MLTAYFFLVGELFAILPGIEGGSIFQQVFVKDKAVNEIKSLISEIEDKPVLWNVFSDEYRDRVRKSEAWREVVAKLQRD